MLEDELLQRAFEPPAGMLTVEEFSRLKYCLIVLSALIPRPFVFLRIKYHINASASPLLS